MRSYRDKGDQENQGAYFFTVHGLSPPPEKHPHPEQDHDNNRDHTQGFDLIICQVAHKSNHVMLGKAGPARVRGTSPASLIPA